MPELEKSIAGRMLAILDTVSDGPAAGSTCTELAERLGRDKSVISRQLKELVRLGVLQRSADGRHTLGWHLFALAQRSGNRRLLDVAIPVMRSLATTTIERVYLTTFDGRAAVTLASEGPRQAVEAAEWAGQLSPLSCTASGRALLFDHTPAEVRTLLGTQQTWGSLPGSPASCEDLIERLAVERTRGYTSVVAEYEPDLVAVAAAVRGVDGTIVAALNISAPRFRRESQIDRLGPLVMSAAARISRDLQPAGATQYEQLMVS
jgi:DNA-binding IclR family transcriptional regulator